MCTPNLIVNLGGDFRSLELGLILKKFKKSTKNEDFVCDEYI